MVRKFYTIKIESKELFEKEFILPSYCLDESTIEDYFRETYTWYKRINHIEHLMYVTDQFDLEEDELVVPLEYTKEEKASNYTLAYSRKVNY